MEKKSFLKGKGLAGILAAVVFLTGFLFVDRASLTGNAVLNGQPSFDPLAIIGILLVICSAALVIYALRRK